MELDKDREHYLFCVKRLNNWTHREMRRQMTEHGSPHEATQNILMALVRETAAVCSIHMENRVGFLELCGNAFDQETEAAARMVARAAAAAA
jgi:hypothetical protein